MHPFLGNLFPCKLGKCLCYWHSSSTDEQGLVFAGSPGIGAQYGSARYTPNLQISDIEGIGTVMLNVGVQVSMEFGHQAFQTPSPFSYSCYVGCSMCLISQ